MSSCYWGSLDQMPPQCQQEITFMICIRNFRQRRTCEEMSWSQCSNPDRKEGYGKVAISLSIGCPQKHFRANRFGNHCRKVYVGKIFMNYLTDKV
ncbi:hypothetical protein AVEN_182823-1 [Araneus ventricosus]|uniref:Uncharacterized protein n=1 Tax=Araneus ventricosus TaxID=182803 RepID=A0A4Y1ZMB7_ARAVE|nr:hypothetical protein AVEN_182823-1 [Araneus ventricosus]